MTGGLKSKIIRAIAKILGIDAEDDEIILRAFASILDEDIDEIGTDFYNKPFKLEDGRRTAYIWKVDEADRQEFAEEISSKLIDHYDREPHALHIVVSNVKGIDAMPAKKFKEKIKPWLKEKTKG